VSQRARELADRYERLNDELIALMQSLAPEQLRARCEGEQCTVAALGSHMAGIQTFTTDWIRQLIEDGALPAMTLAELHEINAAQFARDADRPQPEIIAELTASGAAATDTVRRLTDAQLDRSAFCALFGRDVTTEELIRFVLIGDVEGHLPSIRNAIETAQAG
jgi:hypothetical protein